MQNKIINILKSNLDKNFFMYLYYIKIKNIKSYLRIIVNVVPKPNLESTLIL